MRGFSIAIFLCVAGCSNVTPVETQRDFRSDAVSQNLPLIWEKVEKAAIAVCQDNSDSQDQRTCNFQLLQTGPDGVGANASSWLGADGRAYVNINDAMQRQFQNSDEIAFVLSHEIAHAIARHHSIAGQKSLTGGFSIARVGSQTMELEADVIGAVVAERAGFDPMKGADLLVRLTRTHPSKSKSHPDLTQRLAVISKTVEAIRNGYEIGID